MRIVVNDIAASSGGAMTVLKDFYSSVCENDKENQWIFLLGDKYFEETDNVKIITLPHIKKSALKKVIFDFFSGKKFINSLKPDVVFSMQNIITFGIKVPQIVYIHQSIPFQKVKRFSFLKKSERSLAIKQYLVGSLIKFSAKKSQKVIVQTKWMKESVCEQCDLPLEKVFQIPPNVKNISQFKNEALFAASEFFYPTAPNIYKNNDCIFEACKLLDINNLKYRVTLTLPSEYSKPNIDCIGRIAYEEVIERYNKSTLIFPSYIETFGYPLVEARAMGTIILASDCAFSREALEGYENAYFFDPFKPQQLAILMEQIIDGEITKKNVEKMSVDTKNSWMDVMNTIVNYSS